MRMARGIGVGAAMGAMALVAASCVVAARHQGVPDVSRAAGLGAAIGALIGAGVLYNDRQVQAL